MSDTTPVRFVIVDKITGALDWDGDLHPSREAAIASMCGRHSMYVATPEDVDDRDAISVYWADDYDICEVHPSKAPNQENN